MSSSRVELFIFFIIDLKNTKCVKFTDISLHLSRYYYFFYAAGGGISFFFLKSIFIVPTASFLKLKVKTLHD